MEAPGFRQGWKCRKAVGMAAKWYWRVISTAMYGPLCLLRGVAYVYTSLVKVRGWQDRICLAESCLEFARNGFSFLGTISKIACLAGCCHPHVIFLSQKNRKMGPSQCELWNDSPFCVCLHELSFHHGYEIHSEKLHEYDHVWRWHLVYNTG